MDNKCSDLCRGIFYQLIMYSYQLKVVLTSYTVTHIDQLIPKHSQLLSHHRFFYKYHIIYLHQALRLSYKNYISYKTWNFTALQSDTFPNIKVNILNQPIFLLSLETGHLIDLFRSNIQNTIVH